MLSRRSAWVGVVCVVLVLVGMSGAVTMPAHAAPQSSPTHKLLIRSTGEGATYSVTVSGAIDSGPREKSDTVHKRTVNGHVGQKDTVDAITYTGHITVFNASSPDLKATLDGTFLDALILDANHIQLTAPSSGKSSQPVRYTIHVNKKIVSGEGVEERDSPTNTTTVTGWLLPGDTDGFYFQGEIVSSATSVSGAPNVSVNGQSRSLGSSSQTDQSLNVSSQSTPTPTPQSSPTKRSNRSSGHTLVIEQVNGSVAYTVTITGKVTLKQAESTDAIGGPMVTGRVGGMPWNETSSDPKDVIHFTGELQDFEYNTNNGKIRVRLDGKPIDPQSLVNTPSRTPQPTTPTPTVTTPTTPTTSPTSSTATPTTTVSSTPPVTSSPTVTPTEPQATTTVTSQQSDSSDGSLLDNQFVRGFVGSFIIFIAAGVAAVLYLRMQ